MRTNAEFKNRSWMQFEKPLVVQVGVLLLCLAAASSQAQVYTILHTFGTNVMGRNPHAPLVQGPDGSLYGTTAGGGIANRGQVFKVNPDGNSYTVLRDFTGSDGANPTAGLVLSGTALYGTASGGGTNNNGTVFKVNTDGSGFGVLKSFNSDDGENPGNLLLSGTTLYGTTLFGGSYGGGTAFKVNTDGSGYTVLHNYAITRSNGAANTNADGRWPSTLALSGTALYGTAQIGGTNGYGTLFKLNTDGSNFTVLKNFDGSQGGGPGSVVLSDTVLYGTTYSGGDYGVGTIFKVNTDGSGYTVLKDLVGGDGVWPRAGLSLLSGTILYGTTAYGGSGNAGQVFKINTDGSGFIVLTGFTGVDDVGVTPNSGLLLSGTTLYGTTASGGYGGYGTVYKVATDGSGFAVVTHFAGRDGANPHGSLVLSGTTLYGTTDSGGGFGRGTIFKVNTENSGYTVLKDFTNWFDGERPNEGLVLSGTTLYGTTYCGGTNGSGSVFKINTDGSGYTFLYNFSATLRNGLVSTNTEGAQPQGNLAVSGTTLYGTTGGGGTNGYGTVFKINTDGTGYTVLKDFTGDDGANPGDGLVLSGTTLYGTTIRGGTNENPDSFPLMSGFGTVFRVNTDGSAYTVLKNFNGSSDGASPAGLALSGTTLYGIAEEGGNGGYGAVYKINTDGSGFTVLKYYTNYSSGDGVGPNGRLLLVGTDLYGATGGGGSFGSGVLFKVNADGSRYNVLKTFNGSDGNCPMAELVLSGTTFYGTTYYGGSLDSGVLFSLSLLPTILTPLQTQTAEAGGSLHFAVAASSPPPTYQWFFNGNALTGCTNSVLWLSGIQASNVGAYTVVVSGAGGSVTSAPAMLNVIPAVERRPVPGVRMTGEVGSLLNVDYANALNPAPDWTPLGSVSLTSTSQFYFDLTAPLPPQRFYRAWQTGTPSVVPSLNLNIVPVITLTGNVGDSLRLDYINQFGPIDAWVTLDTVTLTNTSQLYFDVSAPGQPARLYRIIPVP